MRSMKEVDRIRSAISMPTFAIPNTPRTYRTFRKLNDAVKLVSKLGEDRGAKLSFAKFGNDPRDVRYVVNFYGSNPRPRVKLQPRKVYVCSPCVALVKVS